MNILALGAHPDDVEFYCGGTLLKYRKQGHSIFIALTTSGNTGSNEIATKEEVALTREGEQLEAARLYDAQVRFLRFEDEGLQDTPETRSGVLTAVRWANPDVIFTHAPWDPSTDHGMTGRLVTGVLLSVCGNLHPADLPPIQKAPGVFYWDTAAGIGFEPGAYVDITSFMDKKMEALRKHKSQYAWLNTYTPDEDFTNYARIQSEFRGMQAGCKFGEGFIAHRIHGYVADYRLLP